MFYVTHLLTDHIKQLQLVDTIKDYCLTYKIFEHFLGRNQKEIYLSREQFAYDLVESANRKPEENQLRLADSRCNTGSVF